MYVEDGSDYDVQQAFLSRSDAEARAQQLEQERTQHRRGQSYRILVTSMQLWESLEQWQHFEAMRGRLGSAEDEAERNTSRRHVVMGKEGRAKNLEVKSARFLRSFLVWPFWSTPRYNPPSYV